MSDTRIYGSGGGWKGGTGEKRNPARGDVVRFCAAHKVGDVVRGVFIRQEDARNGWVDLDGEQLLARLPETGPRPAPGETVVFRIDALSPEVTLRFMAQGSASVGIHLPLSVLAASYTAARERLDTILLQELWPLWKALPANRRLSAKNSYCRFVGQNETAFAAYAEVKQYATGLEEVCGSEGLLSFRHSPWLMPGGRAVETAMLQKGDDTRILIGALLATGRHLLIDGLLPKGPLSSTVLFRLAVADAEENKPLPSAASLSTELCRCLGVQRVAVGATDMLASLLTTCDGAGNRSGRKSFTRKI